ncbi:MAG: hypothetical protein JWL73_2532 [Actinomycetia bacterium]|nr:hypothetical protein [Actinomycetes bacterium]
MTEVDLYWLPLGAGAHVVRISGRMFEVLTAFRQRRPPRDLYHSALEVVTADSRFTIEMNPIPDRRGASRGVVAEGVVGTRLLRRFRVFRYEIRRWRGGVIADVAAAVHSPARISVDPDVAQRILDLVPRVPLPVWGRDEMHAGEMWNSNSVTAWLLASAGIDLDAVELPSNGRAPGWDAGRVVAGRHVAASAFVLPTFRAGPDC